MDSTSLNWELWAATTADNSPFPHILCENMVLAEPLADINRNFPTISAAGSFPLSALKSSAAFSALIDEINSEKMTESLGEKLGLSLAEYPTMITVRGHCRASDGAIHRDSKGKIVTVLLYLNDTSWDMKGGRLRLLNGPNDMEDYFLETPPTAGTLLAFCCAENAWHGHKPFVGERRVIQLNWVVSEKYRRRESRRHKFSAAYKKMRALFKKPLVGN